MNNFVFDLMIIIYMLLAIAALVFELLKIRATIRQDFGFAMLYKSIARFCFVFALAYLFIAILLDWKAMMVRGFAKIFRYLEVLTHG